MESEIPTEIRMDDGVTVFAALINRIDGFHTSIETKYKEIKVQTQSQSIGHSNLLVKTIELELPSGLALIVTQSPDVTGINKDGSTEFPEQTGAILHTRIQLDISRLVQEVIGIALIGTGAQFADRPPTDTVGTSREIAFFEGHYTGIAIGHSNTSTDMKSQ